MGNLVIKDFPEEVKRCMRVEALNRGIGLRELVLERFSGAEPRKADVVQTKARSGKADESLQVSSESAASETTVASAEMSTAPIKKSGLPGDCKCGHPRRFHFNGQSCKDCGCKGYH